MLMGVTKVDRFVQFKSFLRTPQTAALFNGEFAEWHGGIESYGFWAIELDLFSWIKAFESARMLLSPFLRPGYQRQPHITIIPAGLLDKQHFSETYLERQLEELSNSKITPFPLQAGLLDSFTSVPFMSIVDSTCSLDTIRALLQQTVQEDIMGEYVPHVTLGHYRAAFETPLIADYLHKFREIPTEPLWVKELLFCAYKTKERQSPFEILERVKLA